MQKDWVKFYQENKAPHEPSDFAKFLLSRNLPAEIIVDLGAGNCRDTFLLAKTYETVVAIDPAIPDLDDGRDQTKDRIRFLLSRNKWQDELKTIGMADIVYSRFFLHTITVDEIIRIIIQTNGYFCAEARAVGDKPKIYTDHDRNFVDGQSLLKTLDSFGFEILFFEKARGLAKFQDEDPLVIRVIAKRK